MSKNRIRRQFGNVNQEPDFDFDSNGEDLGFMPPSRKRLKRPEIHPRIKDYFWYAQRVINKCGRIISIGKEHWIWNDSIWKKFSLDQLRPFVVGMQQSGDRHVIKTNGIIEMVRNITQRDSEKVIWKPAVYFEPGSNRSHVMISLRNGVLQVPLDLDESELTRVNLNLDLLEPNYKDLVVSQLPIEYAPEAKCPTFDYLLSSALPDVEDQHALQCFAGYCLLPDHRFQCVLFAHGKPCSGKSLLLYHGIGGMFGTELTSNVSLECICSNGDELRLLENSLLNIGTEIDARQLKDFAVFNQIASGEAIGKALKYDKARRITANCKFIFIGNHFPYWERGSDAQARRIKIIHFPVDFSDAAKDGELEKKVKEETAGIFNWALQGLLMVSKLDQMPVGSSGSKLHTKRFQANNNPMGAFVRKFLEFGKDKQISGNYLGDSFRYWCKLEGIESTFKDTTKLVRRMFPELGHKRTTLNSKACWMIYGIGFNANGMKLYREMRT